MQFQQTGYQERRMAVATTTPPRELATTDEVAQYLRMTRHALIQLRYEGRAPIAVQDGRRLLWSWDDVDAWVEARKSNRTRRQVA